MLNTFVSFLCCTLFTHWGFRSMTLLIYSVTNLFLWIILKWIIVKYRFPECKRCYIMLQNDSIKKKELLSLCSKQPCWYITGKIAQMQDGYKVIFLHAQFLNRVQLVLVSEYVSVLYLLPSIILHRFLYSSSLYDPENVYVLYRLHSTMLFFSLFLITHHQLITYQD